MLTACASTLLKKISVEKERSQKILNTFMKKGNTYIDSFYKTFMVELKELYNQMRRSIKNKKT